MNQTSPTPVPIPQPTLGNVAPAPRERPVFVHIMITLLAVMFVALVSLFWYEWLREPLANALLVVQGNAGFSGAKLELRTLTSTPIATGIMDKETGYTSNIYFRASGGHYILHITRATGQENDIPLGVVAHHQMMRVNLQPPTSAPAP